MGRKIIVFVAIATVAMLTTVFSSTVFQSNSNFHNASSYNTQVQTAASPEMKLNASLNAQQHILYVMFEKYTQNESINLSLLNSTAERSVFFQFINQSHSASIILNHITNIETNIAMLNQPDATDTGPDPQLLANVETLTAWPGWTYGHEYIGEGIFRNGYYSGNAWITTNNAYIEAQGIKDQMLEAFDEYDILGGIAATLMSLGMIALSAPAAAAMAEIMSLAVDAAAVYALVEGFDWLQSTYVSNVDNWGHYVELAYREVILLDGLTMPSDTVYAYNATSSSWGNVLPSYPTYDTTIKNTVVGFLDNHQSNYWYTENVQLTMPYY